MQTYVNEYMDHKEKSNILGQYEIYSLDDLGCPVQINKSTCNDHFHRQFEFFFMTKNFSSENQIHFLIADSYSMIEIEFDTQKELY